ncbi:ephrin-A2-like [Engystomops pustulosus]|uniref:ephrin-A2-like n=1 Tax=Engystomops pustulosus TaxID=76066 RepID=UPI003AFA8AA0
MHPLDVLLGLYPDVGHLLIRLTLILVVHVLIGLSVWCRITSGFSFHDIACTCPFASRFAPITDYVLCPGRFLKEDYTVHVAINDYLDIYCPHYDPRVPVERTETFVLYLVEREWYEGCYKTPKAYKRWECNKPHAPFGPLKFSEKIQRFTPFSLGVEFHTGQDYYYISVPDVGSVGECLKLRVSVCCGPTNRPITEIPLSQPRGAEPGGRSSSQGDPRGRSGGSSPWSHVSSTFLLSLPLLLLW